MRIVDNATLLQKSICFESDPEINPRLLKVTDIDIKVRYHIGDTVEKYVSCDSNYMLEVIDKVGEGISAKIEWVPKE